MNSHVHQSSARALIEVHKNAGLAGVMYALALMLRSIDGEYESEMVEAIAEKIEEIDTMERTFARGKQ
jgi:hypothetical protein